MKSRLALLLVAFTVLSSVFLLILMEFSLRHPVGTGAPVPEPGLSPVTESPDGNDGAGSVVGGDRDEHGCIGSAGYSWCEAKGKCLRVWEESCDASGSDSSACVVQNCHGLDISCGPKAPQMCTMMYALGDRCLQYARCGVQDGTCRQAENPQFTKCKACVQGCIASDMNDAAKQFACEAKCQ